MDDMEEKSPVEFPNEILLHIFRYFDVKQLIINRLVCKRWKDLIEVLLRDDIAWERFCNLEFSQNCREVRLQSLDTLSFFDVYKSLHLWRSLNTAKESIDEFCHSNRIVDEIRDISLAKNGQIIVVKRNGVVYYELSTQAPALRSGLDGDFVKVIQKEDIVIALGAFLHLYIMKWRDKSNGIINGDTLEVEDTFRDVRDFIVADKHIYFETMNNQIFSYKLTLDERPERYNVDSNSQDLVSMSLYNGRLHTLRLDYNIYVYDRNKFNTLISLKDEENILHVLWKYNFIENMCWTTYYTMLWQLKRNLPNGPLRSICTFKVYGDLIFVGTLFSLLKVYYRPLIDGKLDIFNSKPIREYNFTPRIDIPLLSVHPLFRIEIVEVRNGHKVLVVTERKIFVINLTHEPEITKSLVPYIDWKMYDNVE